MNDLDDRYRFFGINGVDFINNPSATDLNHIGTTTEALRLINLYFPKAKIEDKVYPYDENSQKIIYNGEVIGYLVGNIY
ncbi:MAG: hypothetical protein M0R80_04140 [Proteobacteria bacterium]|nr:hypothetical protein [Pseudomonadota bacterium]